jgi:hypothetical protein
VSRDQDCEVQGMRSKIYFEEISKLNFVKDSRITRSASEVEILRGIKLRNDSNKDSAEREKYVEGHKLTVEVPSEEVGVTDSH